ncbi:hypothetical protein D3C72_2502460 [compost metagenome]
MVVHHVEVDDIGASGEHLVHILAQTGEIGGQDRRSDGVGLHCAPQIEESRMARIVAGKKG